MNILEKEIEEIVFQSDNRILAKKGLFLNRHKLSQVNFGTYGIADIICWTVINEFGTRKLFFQVVELKKEVIDVNTLMQASRYVKAINEIFDKFNLENTTINIEIILIGKTIQTNGDFVFLTDFVKNLKVYTYEIDLIDGINFKQHRGWCKTNTGGLLSPLKLFVKDYKEVYHG